MAITFKLKASTAAAKIPTTSDLADGEVGINIPDKVIYQRSGSTVYAIANYFSGDYGDLSNLPALGTAAAADADDFDPSGSAAAAQAYAVQRANHTGTQSASTISDFAATVRSTVLTGLSTASTAIISATDTVLSALGKLQAQVAALATVVSNAITQTITDGDTTHAPSGDAVFDALAGKFDKSGGTVNGDTTIIGTARTQRPSVPEQVFETKIDGAGNAFNSFSSPSNAKLLILGSTTDASNTVPTGGVCGVSFGVLGVQRWRVAEDSFFPNSDNLYTVGNANRRPSEVFAVNGTINTSDAREKTDLRAMTSAELAAAREIAGTIGIHQWLASIEEKGEAARLHVGVIAQRVADIFASHGLDADRYGLFCYDEWEEWVEPAEYGDDGELVREEVVHPAGNRYGIRYSQLAMFLIAAQEARLRALEAQLN